MFVIEFFYELILAIARIEVCDFDLCASFIQIVG